MKKVLQLRCLCKYMCRVGENMAKEIKNQIYEQRHEISNNVVCAARPGF